MLHWKTWTWKTWKFWTVVSVGMAFALDAAYSTYWAPIRMAHYDSASSDVAHASAPESALFFVLDPVDAWLELEPESGVVAVGLPEVADGGCGTCPVQVMTEWEARMLADASAEATQDAALTQDTAFTKVWPFQEDGALQCCEALPGQTLGDLQHHPRNSLQAMFLKRWSHLIVLGAGVRF